MHRHVIVIPPNSPFFFSFLDCIHTGQGIRKALLISLINVASLGFKKLCFFFFFSRIIEWQMAEARSRKDIGALKDSTTVGLAKVNSENKVMFMAENSN
jgi:hypothetical protein